MYHWTGSYQVFFCYSTKLVRTIDNKNTVFAFCIRQRDERGNMRNLPRILNLSATVFVLLFLHLNIQCLWHVPDEIRLCYLVLTPYYFTLYGFMYMVFLSFKFIKHGLMYTVHSAASVICTASSHATKDYVDTWYELICSRHTLFFVCRAILQLIRQWAFRRTKEHWRNEWHQLILVGPLRRHMWADSLDKLGF